MMIRMRSLFKHEFVLPVLIALLMLSLNAYPWIRRLAVQSPGRALVPFHNSTGDYPSYVSAIQQGIRGRLLTYNMYEVTDHKPGLYFVVYSAIGIVASVFGIRDAHLAYHLSRYVLGALWFGVLYLFFRMFFKSRFERTAAFVFAATSMSFPVWVIVNGSATLSVYLSWWTEFDPILRAAFLPHYLVGHILLAISVIGFVKTMETGSRRYFIAALVSGWFAGLIHPPSLMITLMVFPLYSILTGGLKGWWKWVLFCAVTITAPILMSWQARQFPWSNGFQYEGQSFAIDMKDVILGFGPVFFLALFAWVGKGKSRFRTLWGLWVGISLSMIVISKALLSVPYAIAHIVPLSNIRFLQTAMWVPLAALAAQTLGNIKRRWGAGPVIIIFVLYAGLLVVGYPQTVRSQIGLLAYDEDFHAPELSWFKAVHALDELTQDGPVLSLQWIGALIPTYTGRNVLVGHDLITPDHARKMVGAYNFYHGLTDCEAYTFIKKENIAVVFFGFDEARAGSAVHGYPFLKRVKKFGTTELFVPTDAVPVGCAVK